MRCLGLSLFILLIILLACSSLSFPLEIKGENAIDLFDKGNDFRIYSHENGYILIKMFDSNNDPESLMNEVKNGSNKSFNSIFAVGSVPVESDKLGFNVKNYRILEQRPIIVSENNIYGVISEIKTEEDHMYREFLIFRQGGKAFYVYYISDVKNKTFYDFVNNISIKNSQAAFGNDIDTTLTIAGRLDLGKDEEGRPYIIVCKKKDEIIRAARQTHPDKDWLGIVVTVGSNMHSVKEATVDVETVFNGKVYEADAKAYFNLKPKEICEYSLLFPFDKDISKADIEKLIESMEITLQYKENDVQKMMMIKNKGR